MAAPIDEKHGYANSAKFGDYDQPQALALVKRGLEQSLSGLRAVRVPERVDGKKGALA